MKNSNNQKLASLLTEMSVIYRYYGVEERFRSLAYAKAAQVINGLTDDISVYYKKNTLEEIPGIGESIAGKIKEFLKTGAIKKYNQLKKSVPHELLEMTGIKGFGTQTLKQIHKGLRISTKAGLIKALQEGKVEKLKGFGKKKTANMLKALKIHKTLEERMLLWDAMKTGGSVLEWMKKNPEVIDAELCGSLRRRKETVGDIDILISAEQKNRKKVIAHFCNKEIAREVLLKGDTKASIILQDSGRQVDLRVVNTDEWGSALQYFTGSKEHNIHLRTIAGDKGYKISEYGIFTTSDNKKIAGKNEEDIYKILGMQFIPPELREDNGEIEAAAKKKIPMLISPEDIKGDMQMHSNWSDGNNTIEEIAKYVQKKFGYEYIVITDHSKSTRIANGMDEKQILKQIKFIDALNEKPGTDFIKKGIEVDILPDGTLDISDEVLEQLDWVTASIHSNFNRDNTDRLIRACENPFVNCIGHPTGRLIGKREAYPLDFYKLIEAAHYTGTALEINAQPERMDMDEKLVMEAKKKSVKLIISTDSHALNNFDFMQLGVFIARRAWCTPDDILNTKKWSELQKAVKSKRKLHKKSVTV